jgi:ribonuclease Z
MPDTLDQPAPALPTKSYLVQRYAKLNFGQFHIIGFSVAGEETVVQVPEFNICFDIGRSPHFALTSEIVCISHGHMDHVAALGYYASQRVFQGMSPGKILVPRELHRPIERMMHAFREVERQQTPFDLIPMEAGQDYPARRDLLIRPIATHHGGGSLGYAIINVREKLKQEYHGVPGPELARLREQGVSIQYRLEVPLITYLGDTALLPGPREVDVKPVFEHPDVVNAQVLLTECTFFDSEHRAKAKHGKHLHVEQLASVLPTLKCQHIVLLHVSRRIGLRKARHTMRKLIGADAMQRIHFLMDFEGARDEGDVENTAPGTPI